MNMIRNYFKFNLKKRVEKFTIIHNIIKIIYIMN